MESVATVYEVSFGGDHDVLDLDGGEHYVTS